MLAIVCPGQGSQTPGFLAPWLELPPVAGHLASLSEIAGIDLTAHGTTSDEETIKDTAVAQPLIVAAGLVAAKSLFDVELGTLPVILAGHSVGEITASALAGVLTETEAMTFVRERANSMAAAAAATPTGMSAVRGRRPRRGPGRHRGRRRHRRQRQRRRPDRRRRHAGAAQGPGREPAGQGPGHPAEGRRRVPHRAHGPRRSRPCEALRPSLHPRNPQVPLLSNFDGAEVTDGAAAVDSLIAQVSRPVRWDLCMETLVQRGVTGVIELAPAGTLAGLAKRGMPGVKTVTVKTPDDLSAALALFAELEGGA